MGKGWCSVTLGRSKAKDQSDHKVQEFRACEHFANTMLAERLFLYTNYYSAFPLGLRATDGSPSVHLMPESSMAMVRGIG